MVPHEPEKSIGAEETFGTDVDDPAVVRRELLRLSERVAARLRSAGYAGRTVAIKVRFADFTTITRARTLREPTDVGQEIYATARALYEALGLDRARHPAGRRPGRGPGRRRHRARAAAPRRARARLAGGRAGRRPAARRFGAGAVRPGPWSDGQHDPGAAATPVGPARCEVRRATSSPGTPGLTDTVDRERSSGRLSRPPMPAYAGAPGRHQVQ